MSESEKTEQLRAMLTSLREKIETGLNHVSDLEGRSALCSARCDIAVYFSDVLNDERKEVNWLKAAYDQRLHERFKWECRVQREAERIAREGNRTWVDPSDVSAAVAACEGRGLTETERLYLVDKLTADRELNKARRNADGVAFIESILAKLGHKT